jgi:membrane protein
MSDSMKQRIGSVMNLAAIALTAIMFFAVSFSFSGESGDALSVTVFDIVRGGTDFLDALGDDALDTVGDIFNTIFGVLTAFSIAFAVCGGIAVLGNLFCAVFVGARWVRTVTSVASGLAIACAEVPVIIMLVMCFVVGKVSSAGAPVMSLVISIIMLLLAVLLISVSSYIDKRIRRANSVQSVGASKVRISKVRIIVSVVITLTLVFLLVFQFVV